MKTSHSIITLALTLVLAVTAHAELLVDLDARDQDEGPISAWTNQGSLGGTFVATDSAPTVVTIDGVKAIQFDGTQYLEGPASTPAIQGDSHRSIQAWVYNADLASEETVISWGKRGGPDGSNMSFNHGFHNNFGAVGHWGGGGPDIGWNPDTMEEGDDPEVLGDAEEGIWTNIAYHWDGETTRVFTNGKLSNFEEGIALDTHPDLKILIAAQREEDGEAVTGGLRGNLAIAKVQVWDQALPEGQFAFNYNQEAASFGRDLAAITDSDGDGLPDDLEVVVGLDPNAADADGDNDSDGVSNLDEIRLGSDLTSDDSDGDGLKDGEEIAEGTSLTSSDTDGDGLTDKQEVDDGLNPTNADTDGDGAPDNIEIDAGTDPKDPGDSPNTIILIRDATGDESWETPAVWSSGAAAEAGKSYIISTGAGSVLKSPKGQAAFPAGAILTLSSATAELALTGRSPVHFDDLRLQAGNVTSAGSRAGLAGNATIGGDVTIALNGGQSFELSSNLSGDGNLTFSQTDGLRATATLSGIGTDFSGEVFANGVIVEFGGLSPIGNANFQFVEGGIRLITNVLMAESVLGVGGVDFLIDLNGGTAVFKEMNGVDADGNVLFSIDPGIYPRDALLGLGFNEDTVTESEGIIVVLGDEGDSDNDGLWDQWETDTFGNLDQTADGDGDGDGLSNADEFRIGSDPTKADTDDDGLPDGQEAEIGSDPKVADTDGDGINDADEVNREVDGQPAPTDPTLADTDGDRLNDNVETNTGTFVDASDSGTDPLVADTDGGGWPDGDEVFVSGTNPLVPDDEPNFPPGVKVLVDAAELPEGELTSWTNVGGLGGEFVAEDGNPTVEIKGVAKGVTFDGGFMRGPIPSEDLVGNSGRTIEAWVFNPDIESEETVVSWGRRGGPNGTNISFNHGTHNAFGAIGHWGGTGPDIGWDPEAQADDADTGTGEEEAGIWTFIAYTYNPDETLTSVYTNGSLTNTEDISVGAGNEGALDTWAEDDSGNPLNILLASQNDANGAATGALRGNLSIALLRIYTGVLSGEQIAANFAREAERFGRSDSDSDGLGDPWELANFGNLDMGPGDDPDGDGLDNAAELSASTDPNNPDSDDDGFTDAEEIEAFTDPNDSEDKPTAATLVVDLDATGLELGAISEWANSGTLGDFTGDGDTEVIEVDGVRGIDFDGASFFEGPSSTPEMEGRSPRTIEAWIHNPDIEPEETVVSWGHRGGPDGSNMSFNHGTHNAFGAVGHWGNGPDVGWDPSASADDDDTGMGQEEAGIWTYIGYVYDGNATTVYTNGMVTKSENMVLNTHDANNILIAAQRDSDGGPVTGGLRGTMTIAKVRIYDGALTDAEVAASFSREAAAFGRGDPSPPTGFFISSVGRSENGQVEISIATEAGVEYTVEFSTDLNEWSAIGTITGDGTTATFSDTEAARITGEEGYYRIRMP